MNRLELAAIHIEDAAGRALNRARPDAELVQSTLFRILEENLLCSMATVTPGGAPHINTAYFSYSDALELYFLSHPNSLHCRNLSLNPLMAMTIVSSEQRWTDPGQGVQLFGSGAQAHGTSVDDAERSYANRFRAYASWKASLGGDDIAREYRFYVCRVAEVKILDEKTFGDALFVRASVQRRE
jgi:uncharacterized protein YhbP (UPF0306 family)